MDEEANFAGMCPTRCGYSCKLKISAVTACGEPTSAKPALSHKPSSFPQALIASRSAPGGAARDEYTLALKSPHGLPSLVTSDNGCTKVPDDTPALALHIKAGLLKIPVHLGIVKGRECGFTGGGGYRFTVGLITVGG